MNKHTPGPFVVVPTEGCYVKDPDFSEVMIQQAENDTCNELVVAVVITDCRTLKEQGPANAALFAAAPDLLAALRAVEWASLSVEDESYDGCPFCGSNRTIGHDPGCSLAGAIAKATGDTP